MASLKLNPTSSDRDNTQSVKSPADLVSDQVGPLFIGFNVSAALFGVICAQACWYFKQHSRDSSWLKSIVVALLILETVDITLVAHGIFICTIVDHDTLRCLRYPPWSIVMQVIPTALIVAIVQYVWVMRIWTLSRSMRKNQVAGGMLCFVLAEMVMSITLIAKVAKSRRSGAIRTELWPVVACFALKAFNDLSLTGFLCYYLQTSKIGIYKTDSMLQKMMGYGLRAGLFNCMGSIATMALLISIPTNLVYMAVYLVFSRLYTNSLLAMLNWRKWRQTSESENLEALQSAEVELSTVGYWDLPMSRSRPLTTISEFENT